MCLFIYVYLHYRVLQLQLLFRISCHILYMCNIVYIYIFTYMYKIYNVYI